MKYICILTDLNYCCIKYDYLKFSGSDKLDLINRLSTNEVKNLGLNQVITTVLTTDKGRVVDLLTLFNLGDVIFVLCSNGNSPNVILHLEKYTIMDDFKCDDISGTHKVIHFWNDADSVLSQTFNCNFSELKVKNIMLINHDGKHSIIYKDESVFGGYNFIYSVEYKEYWENYLSLVLESAIEFTPEEFEKLRIESGIPKFGNEITENINPLECGLERFISYSKGCYIGQEVIARLDAYDKISKHLIGLKIDREIVLNTNPNLLKIFADDKECGFVTSVVHSENLGCIGLGFIKTIYLDYNRNYKIKTNDELINCSITNLPFCKN